MLNRKRITFCLLMLVTACLNAMTHLSTAHLPPQPIPITQQLLAFELPTPLFTSALIPPASIDDASRERSLELVTPIVRIHYNYYAIAGSTAADLRSQMNQLGPMSQIEGRRYDANTEWHVQWSYYDEMIGDRCVISTVQGSVDVTFTLPQWSVPAEASRSLVSEWDHYLAALQTHEEGHMNNGIAAGEGILSTLSNMSTYASCEELETATRSELNSAIKRYHQKDLEYDQTTQHGQTQGAVFPA